MDLKESDILRACMELLALHPIVHRAWRVNSGAISAAYRDKAGDVHKRYVRFNGVPGHSDIAGVLCGGKALFIEVKKPGGKLTVRQKGFLDDMRQSGALAFSASSTEEIQLRLDEYQHRKAVIIKAAKVLASLAVRPNVASLP
ncbi:MAG: VRR-NUC domain-containing protein [Nitrososphaera sp.]